VESAGQEGSNSRFQVTVYEMGEQLIVFRGTMIDVLDVVIIWNRILIITKAGVCASFSHGWLRIWF
jgi:hypothetical protein